jgi:hypothetical protein
MPAECLQYAFRQPASVVIHGMDKMEYPEDARGGKDFQTGFFTVESKRAAVWNSSYLP